MASDSEQEQDGDAEFRIEEIAITTTAASKAFRLCSQRELRRRVRQLDGTLYRKGWPPGCEFHLVAGNHAIVFTVEDDEAVIITQMHRHADYRSAEEYHPIDPARFDIQ